MILNTQKLLIFAGMLICLTAPALAGGGHHNVTSTNDCYPVDGESAKTQNSRPEYVSKPYARCLAKRREAQIAAQKAAAQAGTKDSTEDNAAARKSVEPRKYFRIIKEDEADK